jgi:hypothetical protein
MTFTLDGVVPWGRNFSEYAAMFALSERDLACHLLGCADGPASFNVQATERGVHVVSCDPIYQFSATEIAARVEEVFPRMMAETRANADGFVWQNFDSVDALGAARRAAMNRFLDDYRQAANERYVAASLPDLPFADDAFDLALSSHFLFLYSAHLSHDFHRASIRELCRVAREVRIFPVITLAREVSPYLDALVPELRADGLRAELRKVEYEFQRGGHTMLKIERAF